MASDGIAHIREQYIRDSVKNCTNISDSRSSAEDLQDKLTDQDQPPAKKPKNKIRGQNVKRPRGKRQDPSEKICHSILTKNECKFGDNCKFLHDKQKFWSCRPADIPGICPLFSTFGICQYGISCRFASSHTDLDSLMDICQFPDRDLDIHTNSLDFELNAVPSQLKATLRKRKYDLSIAKGVLVQLTSKNSNGSNLTCSVGNRASKAADDVNAGTATEVNCDSDLISSVDSPVVMAARQNTAVSQEVSGSLLDTDSIALGSEEVRKIDWSGKLYLAPLTTVGNLPFRRICVDYGADITCGEMAMATNLLQGSKREWALVKRHSSEKLFGVQLAGAHGNTLSEAAQVLLENTDVDFIDLNVGCPIDMVCNKGAGCMLMNRQQRLYDICNAISLVSKKVAKLEVPVTVKMRTGVQDGKSNAHVITEKLTSTNVALFTVHGRSREQRYTKLADWDYINKCGLAGAPVPCFGCGDVLSFEDYDECIAKPGIAGIMLARGALMKPWLFTEIKEKRHWDISSAERLEMLRKYVNFGLEHWGSDEQGVDNTRRFLLEWLSFLHRYIPVGVLEQVPQKINAKPPMYVGRNDLETLMASANCKDWITISELLLGPVSSDFEFLPKHKASAYK